MKVKDIHIDLLDIYIIVFWDCTQKQAAAHIRKKYRGVPKHTPEYLDKEKRNLGCCISDPGGESGNSVIWLSVSPKKCPELLAHEASHAAYRAMTHYGIAVDEEGQELLATLTAFIFRKTLA